MHKVTVSIGSNIHREKHVKNALTELNRLFSPLQLSRAYDCDPVGFCGDNFLNLVVAFECDLEVGELVQVLRSIEDDNGRVREGEKFGSRTLDLDILTYDELIGIIDGVELPRGEIALNAFVLRPLADVIPHDIHPITQLTYQQMWQNYDKESQHVIEASFAWYSQ